MITKLKVRNYKSLRDVEIELGKFNVFIGPNNSGKSNILDCLYFLSDASRRPLQDLLRERGGFERLTFGGLGENIDIEIEFLLEGVKALYSVSLNTSYQIEREYLAVGDKTIIHREPKLRIDMVLGERGNQLSSHNLAVTLGTLLIYLAPSYFPSLSPLCYEFTRYLRQWRSYQFVTSEMRRPLDAKKNFVLDRSGWNLAQVLLSLHTERPDLFDKVEEMLKQAILEIERLLTPLTEDGKTYVAVRERGFEVSFDYYQLSDGTLKLLAYITAVSLPETKLLLLEEPENFIHHDLLGFIVEILQKSEKQVLLSTHSPIFVDFVLPEDIRVVEKNEKGETIVQKIKEPERLKKYLRKMGLGEFWRSGAIGGVP